MLNAKKKAYEELLKAKGYGDDVFTAKMDDINYWRKQHAEACDLVARMHKAAVGEVTGPKRGVVEDVEDVRLRAEAAEKQVDMLYSQINFLTNKIDKAVDMCENLLNIINNNKR
jgi:hypothetical protein